MQYVKMQGHCQNLFDDPGSICLCYCAIPFLFGRKIHLRYKVVKQNTDMFTSCCLPVTFTNSSDPEQA